MSEKMRRCSWATNDLLIAYHDHEYGKLSASDKDIFEKISLESFSCGLSWYLVLKKREILRQAFHQFDIDACAALSDNELETILATDGIIANRRKIEAVRTNAGVCREIISSHGTLMDFVRTFSDGSTLCSHLKRFGIRQFGPVCSEELLKSLGLLPAHEPNCSWADPVLN